MRWFKHFTDNHRGRSIQFLLDELGHIGPCSYYFLMEMCAEKLDQKSDRKLEVADCLFGFHQRVVRQNLRISPANLRRLLDSCQTLGLFTFEFSGDSLQISAPMLLDLLDYDLKKSRARAAQLTPENRLEKNRIEKNRIEKNRIEKNRIEKRREEFPKVHLAEVVEISPNKELNKKIWEAYREEYFSRYGVDPVRNASVNGKISQIAKRLGPEGVEVIRFFVHHPKTFYIAKMHDIGLCLADAEALRTQWAKGKAITNSDLKHYEQNQERADLLKSIERGEI